MDFLDSLKGYLEDGEISSLRLALEKEPSHCLLVNPESCGEEYLLAKYPHLRKHPLIPHAYFYDKGEYDLGKSMEFDLGAFSIQDSAAMLVPFLLSPKPGEIVADMCAAPGSKTAALSFLMHNEGLLLANDLSFPRAKALSQNVERLGLRNVIVACGDWKEAHRHYLGAFDKILLDAPCSGSAMFRKNELAKEDWSPEKVARNAALQRELLEYAYAMLRAGGTLAYSTCSFSHEENEDNIASFLALHPDMHPLMATLDDPCFAHDATLPEGIHLYPHRYEGEGQYVILLKKEGEDARSEIKAQKSAKIDPTFPLLSEYEGRHILDVKNAVYALPLPFEVRGLVPLRLGVKLYEKGERMEPDFASARASRARGIELSDPKPYLHGEAFPLEGSDGYHLLTYKGMKLGYAKLAKGTAKNHYPKGLRHLYKD